MQSRVALRIDDVGASSKRYNVYSRHEWRLGRLRVSGNWLFLKYLPRFRGGGPYREMTAAEWRAVLAVLEDRGAKLTVAITACWAVSESRLIPFPEKFPAAAAVLKEGLRRGLIEVANHGLTHCVLEGNAFRPRWFSSNRKFHREFWDWVPPEVHEDHVRRAQEILQSYFETAVVTLVPPGYVLTDHTVAAAARHGIRYVVCRTGAAHPGPAIMIGEENMRPFHDRDVVLEGVGWFRRLVESERDHRFCFVREIGESATREEGGVDQFRGRP